MKMNYCISIVQKAAFTVQPFNHLKIMAGCNDCIQIHRGSTKTIGLWKGALKNKEKKQDPSQYAQYSIVEV